MREILINYEQVNPTTWAYLSSLLMIAVYFKFNRFFSIRNLDLVGLISLAPALLMIQYGQQHADSSAVVHAGYIWLFVVSALFHAAIAPRCADGSSAIVGAELVCRRSHVSRHLALRVSHCERDHRQTQFERRGRLRTCRRPKPTRGQ